MLLKRCFTWLLPLALACSLSNCSFKNPTGGLAGTAAGAGIGGGIAALLGASKPLIGLAAVAGGSLGYYVTTLTFDSGGVTKAGGQVFKEGEYVTIEIPSDRLFETNTADLLPEAAPILDSAAAVLERNQDSNILISGNTSGFGTSHLEHKLSEARARQVAAYLWAHNVSAFRSDNLTPRKLTYVGYGDYFPIANNLKNDSIRSNSRIQITAYPTNLQLCKDEKVFANVGGASPLSYNKQKEEYANTVNSFKDDTLPEVPATTHTDELSEQASPQTIAEPRPGSFYKK